jgi:predicted nucleotidyltransferase
MIDKNKDIKKFANVNKIWINFAMNKKNLQASITNLKDQLIEKYRPEKIILFGSAAKGNDEINDID